MVNTAASFSQEQVIYKRKETRKRAIIPEQQPLYGGRGVLKQTYKEIKRGVSEMIGKRSPGEKHYWSSVLGTGNNKFHKAGTLRKKWDNGELRRVRDEIRKGSLYSGKEGGMHVVICFSQSHLLETPLSIVSHWQLCFRLTIHVIWISGLSILFH